MHITNGFWWAAQTPVLPLFLFLTRTLLPRYCCVQQRERPLSSHTVSHAQSPFGENFLASLEIRLSLFATLSFASTWATRHLSLSIARKHRTLTDSTRWTHKSISQIFSIPDPSHELEVPRTVNNSSCRLNFWKRDSLAARGESRTTSLRVHLALG